MRFTIAAPFRFLIQDRPNLHPGGSVNSRINLVGLSAIMICFCSMGWANNQPPTSQSTVKLVTEQSDYIKASNSESSAFFGRSVALSEDTLVVGSPAVIGAAYVFVRSGNSWVQQAILTTFNDGGSSEKFGQSVAISGNTVVVGAPMDQRHSDGSNSMTQFAGGVHVFTRSGSIWSRQAYLKGSNYLNGIDNFGFSVAVSGDTIVVGAYTEESNATGVNGNGGDNSAPQAGAAYVFNRSNGIWRQQAYLKASNTDRGDRFGFSVGIDGETAFVGAPREQSTASSIGGDQLDNSGDLNGAVYVFSRSGSSWNQQTYLKGSQTAVGSRFGYSLSISGNSLAVGAPVIKVFPYYLTPNDVYVFERVGSNWAEQIRLTPFLGANHGFDQFGKSISISGDLLVVGSDIEDSSASGVNGDASDNSLDGAGAAYLFSRGGGPWTQEAYIKASNPDEFDRFGTSVAISGETLVVGSDGESSAANGINGEQTDNSALAAGAAYVFEYFEKTTYSVGGQINGLLGSGLLLTNNGGDDLAVSGNGDFSFANELEDGSSYLVTIKSQPVNPSQTCNVTNDIGNVSGADVGSVLVNCSTNTYVIGGLVNELAGNGLVLQLNGGNDLTLDNAGPFVFPTPLLDGSDWLVTVKTQPVGPTETCLASQNTGQLTGASVNHVEIICVIFANSFDP